MLYNSSEAENAEPLELDRAAPGVRALSAQASYQSSIPRSQTLPPISHDSRTFNKGARHLRQEHL